MGKGGYTGGSTVIHAGSGWFGRGSVTSQKSDEKKPKQEPKRHFLKVSKRKKQKQEFPNPKGNGLTIPEQLQAAERKARRLLPEIAQTERRLADLRRQLANAKDDVERIKNLPRRSALGRAHQPKRQESPKPTKKLSLTHPFDVSAIDRDA